MGDPRWWRDVEGAEDAALGVGQLGGLGDGAGVAGEGDLVDAAEFQGDARPGVAGGAFGDADEQQREPAQQHVCADAVSEAVEHRAQLEGGLEVAEPAFGFQQVLVAQRDVLRGQVGVAGGQQELAVQPCFGGDLGPVDDQPARGGLAQVAAQGAVVAQRALGLGVRRLLDVTALRVLAGRGARPGGSDPLEFRGQPGEGLVALDAVA